MQGLPSHRQLLASLVASLSQSPPPPPPLPLTQPPQDGVLLAERHDGRRRLLLTLHVVFPSIVLPALDLLDRRLVMRITATAPRAAAGSGGGGKEDEGAEDADGAGSLASRGNDGDGDEDDDDQVPLARVHVVRSLASTLTRRGGRGPVPAPSTWSRGYLVHLDAWSCSCAGFALEAFAYHAQPTGRHSAAAHGVPSSSPPRPPPPQVAPDGHGDPGPALAFGGMSADTVPGCNDEHAPCCKHLLACLLADRWGGLLGSHVEDRTVTREELAGIVSSL